eukprot:TRINITY_DN1315_c0_g2_i1.p1 TRINITY_DN1315_c0_g2~~TRINITY_DN1315_c0_g2_i1.p1  ORF type:complete len:127 (-),score=11.42 TRINITY_DN1315_c0_g2_i1:98-445(-)
MISISTVALYISYVLPIVIKLTLGRKRFERGPFHLGPFSDIIGIISCLWVITITVLFCLPTTYPVTEENLQYAPVTVAVVMGFAMTYWAVSARFWFKGPIRNLGEGVVTSISYKL